jgi:hypothetical protein
MAGTPPSYPMNHGTIEAYEHIQGPFKWWGFGLGGLSGGVEGGIKQ